jgi:uncharacterized RDD family membrane protein YckC
LVKFNSDINMIYEILQMWDPENWHYMMDNFTNWWWMPLIMGFGGLIYLLISLVIMKYIYNDAIQRKHPNPDIWAILGLVLNVVGLLAYLTIRNTQRYIKPDVV